MPRAKNNENKYKKTAKIDIKKHLNELLYLSSTMKNQTLNGSKFSELLKSYKLWDFGILFAQDFSFILSWLNLVIKVGLLVPIDANNIWRGVRLVQRGGETWFGSTFAPCEDKVGLRPVPHYKRTENQRSLYL